MIVGYLFWVLKCMGPWPGVQVLFVQVRDHGLLDGVRRRRRRVCFRFIGIGLIIFIFIFLYGN